MMPNISNDSREMRQMATGFLESLGADQWKLGASREDIAGSLVRQWRTCNGRAAIVMGDEIRYLAVAHNPLGRPLIQAEVCPLDWSGVMADWHIDPDEIAAATCR